MSAAISRQIVRLPSPELGESDEDHLSDVDDDIDDYLIKDSKEVKVRTLPTPRHTQATVLILPPSSIFTSFLVWLSLLFCVVSEMVAVLCLCRRRRRFGCR